MTITLTYMATWVAVLLLCSGVCFIYVKHANFMQKHGVYSPTSGNKTAQPVELGPSSDLGLGLGLTHV